MIRISPHGDTTSTLASSEKTFYAPADCGL